MATHQRFSSSTDLPMVIVGGGTAGLVIASRLSENSKLQALVLEAGIDHSGDATVLTPGLTTSLQGDPKYDWDFQTVPQVCSRQ